MTLERDGDTVRLVECPFCGTDFGAGEDFATRNRQTGPAKHLESCDAFHRAMDVDPDDPLPLTHEESDARDGRTPTPADRDEVAA